jgi:hypothetical protein
MASRITASTTLVFSYQNVTVTCLLKQTDLAIRPRKPADHVSLSSIFNCQKTDEQVSTKRPNVGNPRDQPLNPVPISMRQLLSDFFKTKVIVASSAAALVSERGYRGHYAVPSMAKNTKQQEIFIAPSWRPF